MKKQLRLKRYRYLLIPSIILISLALLLSVVVILMSVLIIFFEHWPSQFYPNNPCTYRSYLSYLPYTPQTQIIYIAMIGIGGFCCLYITLTLLLFLREKQHKKYRYKVHISQIVLLIIAIVAGICALSHIVKIYVSIIQMQNQLETDSSLKIRVINECFSESVYDGLGGKSKILLVVLILIGLYLLFLCVCLILLGRIIDLLYYYKTHPLPKQEPKVEKVVVIEPKKQIKVQSFQIQVGESSLEELIDPKVVEKVQQQPSTQYIDTGVGDKYVMGTPSVDVGMQTHRSKTVERGIVAVVNVKSSAVGDYNINQGEIVQPQKQQKSQIHRTQLSQYHMTHAEEMRQSRLKSKIRESTQPVPEKKSNLKGYYIYGSSQEEEQDSKTHISMPKVQENQKIIIQSGRLPCNIWVDRQYLDDSDSNRQETQSNYALQKNRKSVLKNLYKSNVSSSNSKIRTRLFSPVGIASHLSSRRNYQQ